MAGYIGPIPVPQAIQLRETFTATANQTSFATGGYTPGFVSVYLNGVKLVDGTDYTGTNGSDIVLASGAAADDILDVVAYNTFQLVDQTFQGDITLTGASYNAVWDASDNALEFGDNAKATFGADADLSIYHDGSRSIIQDSGTGNLRIQANNLELNNADNSENYLFAANNGAVTLYYDNAAKLATTSSGVSITGGFTTTAASEVVGTLTVKSTADSDLVHQLKTNSSSDFTQHIFSDNEGLTSKFIIGYGTTHPSTPHGLYLKNNEATGTIGFVTNSATRALIDSSGNFLVGTDSTNPTSAAVNTAGQEFSTTGGVRSTVDGNAAATFNRKTSAGHTVLIRKDGETSLSVASRMANTTPVGSIELNSAVGAYSAGLTGTTAADAILPAQDHVTAGDSVDLGHSTVRWRNLHAQGVQFENVQGSANILDTYEEGTWTPNIRIGQSTSGTTLGFSGEGHFVRVGNLVQCWGYLANPTAVSTSSTAAFIHGLPFTSISNALPSTSLEGGGLMTYMANVANYYSLVSVTPYNAATWASMYYKNTTTANATMVSVPASFFNASNTSIRFHFSYRAA